MSIGRITKTCPICGKEYEISKKFASGKEARNWEEFMSGTENGMCPECYKESKKKELLESVEKYNLPELTGSEKQIAWAEEIRAKLVSKVSKPTEKFFELVNTKTSAKWWIDNRDVQTARDLAIALIK